MDTITHGIAGALIGKAFFTPDHFADPEAKSYSRTAILGATLSAVFPDSDYLFTRFGSGELSFIRLHRYVTHSFLCLPAFAVLVAVVVLALARWQRWRSPSLVRLTWICAVGIASHIVSDLITSYGTMIWSPWSTARPAWDLVFIIDFTFTGIVLVPQILVWIYRGPREKAGHGWGMDFAMWLVFTVLAEAALWLAPRMYFPYSPVMAALGPLVLAVVFFAPQWRGFGYRVRRSRWCRTGVYALCAYLVVCAAAHAFAERRVREFAAAQNLQVEALGALPVPPSANYWDGLIRTPRGVYEAQFALLDGVGRAAPPFFHLVPDSPRTVGSTPRAICRWCKVISGLPGFPSSTRSYETAATSSNWTICGLRCAIRAPRSFACA